MISHSTPASPSPFTFDAHFTFPSHIRRPLHLSISHSTPISHSMTTSPFHLTFEAHFTFPFHIHHICSANRKLNILLAMQPPNYSADTLTLSFKDYIITTLNFVSPAWYCHTQSSEEKLPKLEKFQKFKKNTALHLHSKTPINMCMKKNKNFHYKMPPRHDRHTILCLDT